MPEALVQLLRECFQMDPSDRPETMAVIVDRLRSMYRSEAGLPWGLQCCAAFGRDEELLAWARQLALDLDMGD